MPVPQKNLLFVERASCPFLRMLQDVSLNGCALNLTDARAYDLVMRVARGTMTKEELSREFESCIV